MLIKHRRSCCLYYRCDRTGSARSDAEAIDAEWLARFGHDPPHYCDTCPFRPPDDVEARTLFAARSIR